MGTMKPLKVSVMQEHVISHQMFAIKVVKWIEGLLEKSGAFRNLFATILEEVNVRIKFELGKSTDQNN